ncbi:MAG: hypothetical protein WCG45_01435, partial [bacterium]
VNIVGKYFYISEFWKKEGMIKKLNKTINPIAGILLVLFAISYSFYIIGSPATQRLLRLDDKRISDLQSIQYQVINYWQQKEKLPENLALLSNPMTGFSLPMPPDFGKGEKYEYNIKDNKTLTFQLCADFSLPIPKDSYYGGAVPVLEKVSTNVDYPISGINESWNHEAGRICFERTIDKDIYPPLSKTK